MRLIVLCTGLLIGTAASGAEIARAATIEEWRHDLDSIVHDILAIHPDPFARIGELTWRREAATLKEAIPGLSEPQRIVRLMQLVALLGDGHTLIDLQDQKYALWYPLRIYEFSDGYFVTSAHDVVREIAGAQLLEIAGRPIGEVVDSARTLFDSGMVRWLDACCSRDRPTRITTHQARQDRFRQLDWYRPPTEIALRFIVFDLIEQQRFEDALETARLNAEIHPFTWNTWYNLAGAQNAAGSPHKEQRFASYACVAALAPTNWNVPAIQQLFRNNNVNPRPAPGCPVGD